LGTWLGGDLIQFFGRRSYSIYLVHFVVGLRGIDYAHRLLGDSPAAAFAATLGGVAATLLFSEATYRWIERPSLKLAKKVKPFFDAKAAPAPLGG
jgi:peptidoglycan/LPS O-acetylase OafA/YrhL